MNKFKSFVLPTFYVLIMLALFSFFSRPAPSETAAITDDTPGFFPGGDQPVTSGTYRGVSTAVKFDVSPPLTEMIRQTADLPVTASEPLDLDSGWEMPLPTGPQDLDPLVQSSNGPNVIPTPEVSFDAVPNIAGFSPPDPVGDVGPNHYVAMTNVYTGIYDKVGNELLPPFPNNTFWAGFGGDCQNDNSGDPVVLYDQFADRWMVTQFTASGPTYFNCVAISQTPDPTGAYYRYAFGTGTNFPDYPKYGIWHDAYYISTREFGPPDGVGAYALERDQMLIGNPAPQVISFLVQPGATPYNIGDGLLPTDLDGNTMPPAGAPNYFVGTMDDGAQYGAPSDALNVWEFHADFVTPGDSTFTLEHVVPVAPFDSQFPCSPGSRNCIPQPGTSNKIDILSYRQRPLFRLAYRNFGTHESLVTNQSVEAAPNMAGIRWYELRDPDATATLYQQGTYAPGVGDDIHRWMGSIAMDQSGNMALGYSASNATSTFPSVWYTGRLNSDPLGTMPQGEGSIVNGTGSQTGSARWGDYTSMNIDPVDDCTFWYVNEYVPVSSSSGWQLRVGAFKFPNCGPNDFSITAQPATLDVCTPNDAIFDVTIGATGGYTDPVTLSTLGNPAGTTATFVPNNQNAPYASTLTIGNTGSATPGSYSMSIIGIAPTSTHTTTVQLGIFGSVPVAPILNEPIDGATDVSTTPFLDWNVPSFTSNYLLEVATDAGFTNIVYTATINAPASDDQIIDDPLDPGTTYFWRVTGGNVCGASPVSAVFDFTTRGLEYCSAPDLAISGGPHTDNLVISDNGLLTDVTIELNMDHSWIGDLSVSLEHVASSTSVSLIDRPGNPLYGSDGCNDNNFLNFTLLDGSTNGPHDNGCSNSEDTPAYAPATQWDPIAALAAFNGEDVNGTWRLTVTDAATGRDTGNLVRWCIIPEVAPTAAADSYSTDADVTLNVAAPGVLSNDGDLNGDPLTAVLDTDVSDGSLTLYADGSFTYTPDAGFYGTDSFTYHANDGTADSNTVTVTIDVIQDEFDLYMPAIFKP